MSKLTDFLQGVGPDAAGRMIDEVLRLPPADLERFHDFIQWLFPLPEPSAAVPGSPVLSIDDIALIHRSEPAQRNLAEASALMSGFYAETDHWLRETDHNHLRITRIVRSLRVLVDDAAADTFAKAIHDRVAATGAPISSASRAYWAAA